MILSTRPSTAVTWPTSIWPEVEHLAEDVRERQPQVLHVVAADQPGRGDRLRHVRPVVVQQAHALGAAGGAGGVDEGGQLVLGDRADPLLDQLGVLLQPGGTARLQFVEAEHPVAGLDAGRVDDHDMGEVGQLGALLLRLGELVGVLRDQHPAARSPTGCTPTRRRWSAGRPSSCAAPAHMMPRSARIHSIRVAEARATRCSGLHAQLDQPGRDGVDPLGGLAPAQRLPVVRALTGGRRHRVAVRLGRPAWRPRAPGRGPRRTADGSRSVSVCRSRHPPGPATVRLAQVRLVFTGCCSPSRCLTRE
ncbi:hypothetical protein SVIOM74S_01093 [Streptomyces violarus]